MRRFGPSSLPAVMQKPLQRVVTLGWRVVILGWMAVAAVAGPSARAQVLVDTLTAAAAQQQMQAGNAAAVVGAGGPANLPPLPPLETSSGGGLGGVKYLPAYVIVLMLVAVSTFVVCRPGRRYDAA